MGSEMCIRDSDGSILAPGMEVGSLQMTPTYAKHMEFTYAIQPVMVG